MMQYHLEILFWGDSFMFRHVSAFCFESAAKYSEKKDEFSFAWHSSVIRPVKWSSFKEEYSTEVIFLRRLQKKLV